MIVLDCEQRSPEWYAARLGVCTASEFAKILSPTGKASTQADTYLYRLLGEWLTGKPEEGYKNYWMDRGSNYEEEARDYFSLQTDHQVKQVGFVYQDERKLIGCSPDGLLDPTGGMEMKAPSPGVHVRYLLRGELPTDYIPQVQGSMWITESPFWYFVSYHPDAPSVIIRVERDEKYIEKLAFAVNNFIDVLCEKREELIARGFAPRPVEVCDAGICAG